MESKFFLLGDSHANAISLAALRAKIPFLGGSLAAGRFFNDRFFELQNEKFYFIFPEIQEKLNQFLKGTKFGNLADIDIPIISTLGFNTIRFANRECLINYSPIFECDKLFLSSHYLLKCVRKFNNGAISFYKYLIDNNKTVYAVYSPQRFSAAQLKDCFKLFSITFENIMTQILVSLGVKMLDVRHLTTDENGNLLAKYYHSDKKDYSHANVDFGQLILKEFFAN